MLVYKGDTQDWFKDQTGECRHQRRCDVPSGIANKSRKTQYRNNRMHTCARVGSAAQEPSTPCQPSKLTHTHTHARSKHTQHLFERDCMTITGSRGVAPQLAYCHRVNFFWPQTRRRSTAPLPPQPSHSPVHATAHSPVAKDKASQLTWSCNPTQ